ncbi:ATP-binding protein [Sorangium sp. So ce861]|uniref:ATP-binding protein n=1 Tax=Sorangium sp. So ce861 TaxID=3133323 RepID=UPI003F636044
MPDQGAAPAAPLDAIGHLLAELRRLDLILWQHVREGGFPEGQADAPNAPPMDPQGPSGARGDPGALLEEHTERLRAAVQASRAAGARLPLIALCERLELDPLSIGVLMLALAPHVDRHYERVYGWLQGDAARTAPRMDLALQVFGGTPAERLALRGVFRPDAPLLRSGFVRLVDPPDQPAVSDLSRVLWVSPRLLRFLTDQPAAEPEVEAARAREPLPPPTSSLLGALGRFAAVWARRERPGPVGVLRSEDPAAALASAAAIAGRAGAPALLVDLAAPGASRHAVERVIEASLDEARLLGALAALSGFDELAGPAREAALGAAVAQLGRFDGACLLIAREAPDLRHELRRRPVLVLDAPLPEVDERAALWAAQLGDRPDTRPHLPDIARLYRLGSGQIRDAARMVETLDVAEGPSPSHLRTASQAQSRQGLGELAQRVPERGAWGDLVLPPPSVRRLRSIVDHLRHRDTVFRAWGLGSKVASWRGVTAMFAGPPGTGKTLSASLIAQALGLPLFRIDLAGVVSKYIGETEKNLDRVFRAAYRSNAVIFFDEADALFGKRTEVKDAHDRYANVETSYLLQKLELFEGLAVLATNLKKNIDPAFMRRIDVLVDFPFPSVESRLRLWQTLLPAEMPREAGLDLAFLAERFELSGGHIKNAVQAAALAAAAEESAVGMRHLVQGVRWELQKQGKLAAAGDFGPYADLLPEQHGEGEGAEERPEVVHSRAGRRR